ncbi:hypothetical protein BDZ97DRAFT_753404 [Flammula alnicola]|nr:hypothetical protein BDZ97DRAFT_753404 [Flammula alnicola]
MIDPLSLALAVITLATALKDLHEVGVKIYELFAKGLQNLRNAQQLMNNMLKTLRALNTFCNDHYENLDRSSSMKAALGDLAEEMLSVYTKCSRLIPPSSEKMMGKIKIAVYSFKNRNKVEELIAELKNHVNECYIQFLLFSNMRIESGVTSGFAVLAHSNAEAHRELRMEISNIRLPNSHLYSFTQTYSTTMSRVPDSVPAHVLSDAYLRLQIEAIDKSLKQLSSWFQDLNPRKSLKR